MFGILVLTVVIIFMWPTWSMRWCFHIVGGLSLYACIVLWAIILDNPTKPPRTTPPLGVSVAWSEGQ